MTLTFRQLRTITFAMMAAIVLGLGSARLMLASEPGFAVLRIGPWVSWQDEGTPGADPYTRAHLAKAGRLPMTATVARHFFAETDSDGRAIDPRCEYHIDGLSLPGSWWSIAVYSAEGEILANLARRYAFSSQNLQMRGDGAYRIVLSASASPGNWLPVSGEDPLVVVLRLLEPAESEAVPFETVLADALPSIRRIRCDER